ncbi:alpha/beta fold hydrolase [Planctomycetota bacterium]
MSEPPTEPRRLHVRELEPLAILWVHAFPLDGRMWRAPCEQLTGYRHLIPDLPGFGDSAPTRGPLTMEGAADMLVEVLDGRKIERAVTIGCSMGGYIALALARNHPDRLRALVLVDTRAEADSEEQRKNRETFAETVLRDGVGAARDALLPKLLASSEGPAASFVTEMIEAASPEGIANALRGMGQRADSTAQLSQVRVPTLVLVGEEDQLTPKELAAALAAGIPGARLEVIPGAAHLPPVEAPGQTARALGAFLKGLR